MFVLMYLCSQSQLRLLLPIIGTDALTEYTVNTVHKDTTGSQDVFVLAKCPVI